MLPKLHTIHRPDSVSKAVRILKKGDGNAAVLAGGTSLVLSGRRALLELVDLRDAGLDAIELRGGRLHLGAMVRMADLERSETALRWGGAVLTDAAAGIGSTMTRNLVTVGGNVCQLLPWCHLPPALAALGAKIHLAGAGIRSLDAEAFFAGPPRKILGPAGIVTGVSVPVRHDRRSAFARFARTRTDRALVTVAVAFRLRRGRMRDVRIFAGACTPRPQRAARAEALLEGRPPAPERFESLEAGDWEDVRIAQDLRASGDYKRRLLAVLAARAAAEAFGPPRKDGGPGP